MTTEEKKHNYSRLEKWYNSNTLLFGLIMGTSISNASFDMEDIDCDTNYMIYMHMYSVSYNVYCCIMRIRREPIPDALKPRGMKVAVIPV